MRWIDNALKHISDSVLNAIGLLAGIITIASVVPFALETIVMLCTGAL